MGESKRRASNPKKQATRAACWTRGQQRKKQRIEKNERLHKAKQKRRAEDALTKTDLMWVGVKAKFAERRALWLEERQQSDWYKAVGRVPGRTKTLSRSREEESVEAATKPKTRKRVKTRA